MLPDSALLDSVASPDAMLSVDASGIVVGVNSQVERLLGWHEEELLWDSFFGRLQPRDAEGFYVESWPRVVHLRIVRAVPQFEVDLMHVGGRMVKCALTARLQRKAGEFAGAVISLRDLAGRRLESGAARMVATVAHEIRAPLTGVRGFASLLLRKGDAVTSDQREEMLGQIVTEAERMTRLVGELLDVSRLEAGRLILASERVSVADVVSRAVAQARSAVEGAGGVEIDVDVSPEHAVIGDPDKVLQIVANLVENAVKYGDAPLTVSSRSLPEREETEIGVHDTGYIPPEILPRIFSKYWRRERPGRPSGTGLGLYISKGLAEAQDGRLEATSSVAGGTTFTVRLPGAADSHGAG
ncbi:MAG: PAS domain-containing protein [Acidimicrobiia bacterium]|nr:PAS domain-containing protein [Acidimicrobiia bacterium]